MSTGYAAGRQRVQHVWTATIQDDELLTFVFNEKGGAVHWATEKVHELAHAHDVKEDEAIAEALLSEEGWLSRGRYHPQVNVRVVRCAVKG